jgi:hypothetical protein
MIVYLIAGFTYTGVTIMMLIKKSEYFDKYSIAILILNSIYLISIAVYPLAYVNEALNKTLVILTYFSTQVQRLAMTIFVVKVCTQYIILNTL